jgi:regulator of ribonuclease activity A
MKFSTADLFDDFEDQLQSCELSFQNFGGIKSFFGQISTIRCHEDNSLIRQTLSERGQGRVLVIDGAGSLRRALVGDMIAELACGNGWSGIVVNGAIRDSVAFGNLQIGFKALGTNPRKSTKTGSGFQNIPLQFGNISFTPNHWIYCDSDGVAVSPINLLA